MNARQSRQGGTAVRQIRAPARRAPRRLAHGLTLIELMVSMTLGMFVVLAATAILMSSKAGYVAVDDGARLQETGRFAIEIITRNARQAAFENWDRDDAPIVAADSISASIAGLDNQTLGDSQPFISGATDAGAGVNNDVLALRYFGSGTGNTGDGTVLNCAGFGVAAPATAAGADTERGASVFYVGRNSSGVSELRCKYNSSAGSSWQSEAIISGVDSFQVLYGLDMNGNGMPTRFVRANVINDLDRAVIPYGGTVAAINAEKNRRSHWKKVVAIKVALLISGNQPGRNDERNVRYDLFGEKYSEDYGTLDRGTRIVETNLPPASRDRPRKLFTATIQIRNRSNS